MLYICISSIVQWGDQDNFKCVYIFYEKILHAQKAAKGKTSNFHPLRSLWVQNVVALVV